jgi:hypothetical protein
MQKSQPHQIEYGNMLSLWSQAFQQDRCFLIRPELLMKLIKSSLINMGLHLQFQTHA